ncbi:MAG: site-specific integrase [Bacteroidaceae bacterium]|nr:site-specific integrase [Bacteroidaceae bacterium]
MKKIKKNPTLSSWIAHLSDEFRLEGRIRTSITYRAALKSFMLFRKNKDIKIKDLDTHIIQQYERFLLEKGLVPNSISFYMRILRAAYNKACDQGYVPYQQLFKRVYTGVSKTTKRAIPLADIRRIKQVKLESYSSLALARDMFMFSFYTRGMSFVDMAFLKTGNLNNGYLIYRRKKTGQLLKIKWEPCMQEIVKRYATTSPYLLPIIHKRNNDLYYEYQNRLAVVNRNLKVVGQRAGLNTPLSMYVARHSWATGAKQVDVPINVISDAMGHESERTTRIYLASLLNSKVDDANKKVLEYLEKKDNNE